MPTTSKASTSTSRSGSTQRRSRTANSAAAKTAAKDAIALLKEDHRKVEELFSQYESARKDERKLILAETICEELTLHAALEETIFYPAVREALKLKKDQKQLDEAIVEHSTFKWLISRVQSERTASRVLDALMIVLKEYVEHHVKEEEKEMFPSVRDSALDTRELGAVMQAHKQKVARRKH